MKWFMYMKLAPPSIPRDAVYTGCYCEENIYFLAQAFSADPDTAKYWDIFVVFISNRSKTVALWCQKLANESHRPVVWDYHVVLVLRLRNHVLSQDVRCAPTVDETTHSWVYDFDTILDLPCALQEYLDKTFEEVSLDFQSLFRVIPCSVYLNHFASDRSHMLAVKEDARALIETYHAPPPLYEPIRGAIAVEHGISNNLVSGFVCMDSCEGTYGDVVAINSLRLWG